MYICVWIIWIRYKIYMSFPTENSLRGLVTLGTGNMQAKVDWWVQAAFWETGLNCVVSPGLCILWLGFGSRRPI